MLHFAFLMLGRLPNSSEPSPEGGSGIGTREWGSSRRGPARGPATSASLISVGLRRCSKILLICLQQICNCLGALTLCTVLVSTGNTSALDLVGLSVTRMWDRLQKLVGCSPWSLWACPIDNSHRRCKNAIEIYRRIAVIPFLSGPVVLTRNLWALVRPLGRNG